MLNGLKKLSWLAIGVAIFVAGYALGSFETAITSAQDSAELDPALAPVQETWNLIQRAFVDPVDEETVIKGAIDGMLAALEEPNTNYMPADAYQIANTDLTGSFEGIGANVRQDESGALVIVSPIPGSPAEEAGILPNDAIVEVDGEDITDFTEMDIITKVRGPAGTDVLLGIRRPGEPGLLQITITRAKIAIENLHYEMLDDNVGYIEMAQFDAMVGGRLREALTDLIDQGMEKLIFDLRGDPGGYLNVAVDAVSAFINEGVVLLERSSGGVEKVHQAFGNAVVPEDIEVIVLVDAGSASASEIVAGALQEYGRATVAGEPTFGKGSIQIWHPLSNGGAVRITTGRWYTPEGKSVSGEGVTPDVMIPWWPRAMTPGADPQLEGALRLMRGDFVWETWPHPLPLDARMMGRW